MHEFSGSRHNVGRMHGTAFSAQIRSELGFALVSLGAEADSGKAISRAKALVPWIRQNLPGYLDEVHGLAEGAGIHADAALFLAVSDGMRACPDGECTSFYCGPKSTADGSVFLGQTKDTPPRDGRYFVMRFAYEGAWEMILLNYAGWLANIGITSRGMGLCGNALYVRNPTPDALPFSLLKRAVLESRDLQEAVQFVEAAAWQDGCLGIADRTGRAVFAELFEGTFHCHAMTDDAHGHANSILAPVGRHLDRSSEASPCSLTRQRTVDRILQAQAGSITAQSLRALTGNHDHAPASLCRHSQEALGNRTTAAILANLTAGWMDVAIGSPCTAAFQRHQLRYGC